MSGPVDVLTRVAACWGIDSPEYRATAELIEADREYDTACFEWQHSDRYELDSYGIPGSEFYICLACEKQSGAGILNKGITHETDCKVAALERAEARRAAALANIRSAS